MNCTNEYCIYNCEFKCTRSEIYINQDGLCDDSIIVSLDRDFLVQEKERQLREILQKGNGR